MHRYGCVLLVLVVVGQEILDESEGSGAGDDDDYAANTTYVRLIHTGRRVRWAVPAGIHEASRLS